MIKKCWINLLFFFLSQSVFAQTTIDKMIVFGDSLSDNGNIYSITSKLHKTVPPIPVIPKKPPYYKGRFSNGLNWADNAAAAMEIDLADYAYGGSWAEPLQDSGQLIPFSLGMQVNFYLVKGIFDRHKENHLYVVWSGSNDYLQGRPDPVYATSKAVATIEKQVTSLIYYGAKQFLIMGIPDLSGTPEVAERGPEAQVSAKEISYMHNEKLEKLIQKLREENKDVTFVYINIVKQMEQMLAHPEEYHLKNIKEACYKGGYYLNRKLIRMNEIEAAKKEHIDILNNPSLRTAYITSMLAENGVQSCSNPDEYLYWDQVHPTRVTHYLMSLWVVKVLSENGLRGA